MFGGTDKTARKFQIKTEAELEKLLKHGDFNKARRLQLVEVYMPKNDAPQVLVKAAEASAQVNAERSKSKERKEVV